MVTAGRWEEGSQRNSEEGARAAAGRQAGAGWLAGQCAAVCDLDFHSLDSLDFSSPGFVFKAACGQGKYPFFQVSGIGCPGEGSGGMVSHS